MKTDRVKELTAQILRLEAEIDALKVLPQNENRQMNDEELAQWAKLNQQYKTAIQERKLEQQELDVRLSAAAAVGEATKPFVGEDALQAKFPGLPPKELRFADFGEQLRAIINASNGGIVDRRLYGTRAAAGMNEANPSDGGFLVQTDFATGLLQRAFEGSPVLSRVRRIPIGANSNGIKLNAFAETSRVSSVLGGIIPYWVGEGYDKTESMPQFRQIELSLKKLCALWYCTDEVLQDATALASVAERGFAEAIDVELERVIIRGTGAGQPLGILNAPCLVSVTRAQAGNTISATDVIAMFARFRGGANSVWLASRSIVPQLFAMSLNDNLLYLPPSTGLREAPGGTLLGYPVVFIENASALGTVGDLTLASLDDYLLATKGGPQMASSVHVKFVSDQTTFRMVVRVDGQPWDNSALTPKDNSSTVGPFVALASA